MDLLFYAKAKAVINVIIPVDVLIELKNDGVVEVSNKIFKKYIGGLANIMVVNPDKVLSHSESIREISGVYSKVGYTSCIITLDEKQYTHDPTKNIIVVSPQQIILTLLILYGIAPQQFSSIIDEWLEKK